MATPSLRRRSPRSRITVTQDNISRSARADSSHCMIANAVREAIPQARNISVDLQTIRYSDPERGVRYTYLTSAAAQAALVAFDEGSLVEPFSFTISNAYVAPVNRRSQRPRIVLSAAEKAPDVPQDQRRNHEAREARLSDLKVTVLRLIEANGGEIPSGRRVARALGKTDDRAVRAGWDTLADRGELPPRHQDRSAVHIEGTPGTFAGTLPGDRRVYGMRSLRLRQRH
jgi:hypothetical protein